MANEPQVPWTDEQWARVNQIIQEEASRARVAATFLPLFGPLPASTDFIRSETISLGQQITIADKDTIQLATLQVKVFVRGAQMADPEMTSVLALFRRAANVLARLEDAVIFIGQPNANQPPAGPPNLQAIWQVVGGQHSRGLFDRNVPAPIPVAATGQALVSAISDAIGRLEANGQSGPFAVVLDQGLFLVAQTPDPGSLVLPQDRIVPFLGGGSLLRSSTLPANCGLVVALGGAPVELAVATDVSVDFLQVTTDPIFVFRLYEKMALRIKESDAIVALVPPAAAAAAAPAAPAAPAPAPAAPPPPAPAPAGRRKGQST
jgi:uncharacterized linocin/CFP29 family protein